MSNFDRYKDQGLCPGDVILKKYQLEKILGQGGFGTVYLAFNIHDNTKVALKINNAIDFLHAGIPPDTIREISFLIKLARQEPPANVVRLLDADIEDIYGRTCIILVLELMRGTLLQILPPKIRKRPFVVQGLMKQLLEGVYALHRRGIIHRDIKPENLLIKTEPNGEIFLKIADLGMGRALRKPLKHTKYQICTLWYRAPEIVLGSDDYGPPVDVWSVGAIFAEMANANKRCDPLFPARCDEDLIPLIVSMMGLPKQETMDNFKKIESFKELYFPTNPMRIGDMDDLLSEIGENGIMTDLGLDLFKKMMQWDPNDRITVKKALEHPYFEQDLD